MPTYKLHYFELTGRAEGIRLTFHYAGVPFEDIRIPRDEWPAKKETFKYQQVPVLEVDGHVIAQANAILRYVARNFGLEGKTEFETAKLDELNELFSDLQNAVGKYPAVVLGFAPGDRDQLRKENLIPAMDKYLPLFENVLKESGSGFFVKSGPTYLDFHIGEMFSYLRLLDPELWAKYPVFEEHLKRVYALPQLKNYLASRPKLSL